MAVQAQYPANILFLNNRNGQESTKNINNDDSLQHQLDIGGDGVVGSHGLFFDGSQMFFNSNGNAVAGGGCGGGISRKRGRGEMTIAANTSAATNANVHTNINPFNFSLHTHHHHQPQIIDLTQLQHQGHLQQQPPPNGVSTGLRLSFGEQQKQHHHIQQQQQQQLNNDNNNNHQNLISSDSSFLQSVVSDEFANEIKQQNHDLNQFIQVQGEHLRSTLAEKRQTHYRALLEAAEEMVCRRLREKDAEVQKAIRCNAELEARAAQLTAEAQVWQAKAQAQESEAATLQAQLQQVMLSGGGGRAAVYTTTVVVDKDGVEGAADDAESAAYIDPERVNASWNNRVGPICKACRRRAASLVVLPCRHLCVCTECDAVAQACPVCLSVRNGSIQVYLT